MNSEGVDGSTKDLALVLLSADGEEIWRWQVMFRRCVPSLDPSLFRIFRRAGSSLTKRQRSKMELSDVNPRKQMSPHC